MLAAGAARSFIDPPLPNDPQGYVRREAPALEHGDPLEITGVVLERGDAVMVILAADLTGYDQVMAARIRDEVGRAIGCDPAAVLLNASHSHAAPWARADDAKLGGGHDGYTPGERAYVDRLPYDFASVALMAWRARRPARAAGGTGRVTGVAVNRRERTEDGRTILGWNPDLTIDEEVPTIRIDSVDGDPIATITAFGCHPVVVGPEVGKTGTDFVGPLRRRVEELRGGGVCVFLQGAAGNVLPLEAFFDHEGPELDMGGRLGLEAAHAIADADPLAREIVRIDFGSVTPISLYRKVVLAEQPDQPVAFDRRIVDLPMLATPSQADIEAELAELTAQLHAAEAQGATRAVTNPIKYHVNWLTSMLAHGDQLGAWTSSPGEVWAMRVGDCAIVGTPGELFSEIGQAVRSASPFATTLFAGYCQGIIGYVATPEEYPYGGYEPAVAHRGYAHPAPFAPEAAQLLIDTSLDLLAGLYEGRG
jgi:neutral ceramidase